MADDIKEQKMEYTFATTFFLNIPLATVEYLICILLAGALLDQKADWKKAVLLWIPYILLLIIPASLFFVLDLYGNFGVWLAETYLEAACFGLVLKGFYQTGRNNSEITGLELFRTSRSLASSMVRDFTAGSMRNISFQYRIFVLVDKKLLYSSQRSFRRINQAAKKAGRRSTTLSAAI